jgi:hypothetical protein
MRVRARLRCVSLTALTLTLLCAPRAARSQGRAWDDVVAGSDNELYLRTLQLLGNIPATSWTSRPLSNAVLDSARIVIGVLQPWAARFAPGAAATGRIRWRGVALQTGWNSAFPWGGNDGALWQGKGISGTVTTGALFRWRPLTIRVEPVFVYAQNAAFPVLPTESGIGLNTFVDRMRPVTIDLPDRFGTKPLERLDLGESEIRLEGHGLVASVSNRSLFLGPAFRNSLILGANAPGFAHLALGTSDGLRTPIGRLAATVIYGRLSQSAFAPAKRTGARLSAGAIASWRPPSGRGLELGAVRFYHRDWPSDGLALGDLKIPFGSLFGDREVHGAAPADNQVLSLFGRAVSTRIGLEVFGEFGRNDRSANLRDLIVEPEHNSAWSAGVLKVVGTKESSHYWTTRFEYMNGRTTSLQRFRDQATFYEHYTISQGHTNFGQLLGSPLLERTGGFELAIDRWQRSGRVGGMLQERSMPLTRAEGVPAGAARSQWALEFNGDRAVRTTQYGWRTGIAWDLNRTPGTDVANYFVGGSIKIGRY